MGIALPLDSRNHRYLSPDQSGIRSHDFTTIAVIPESKRVYIQSTTLTPNRKHLKASLHPNSTLRIVFSIIDLFFTRWEVTDSTNLLQIGTSWVLPGIIYIKLKILSLDIKNLIYSPSASHFYVVSQNCNYNWHY